jgi:hypothetical protein
LPNGGRATPEQGSRRAKITKIYQSHRYSFRPNVTKKTTNPAAPEATP